MGLVESQFSLDPSKSSFWPYSWISVPEDSLSALGRAHAQFITFVIPFPSFSTGTPCHSNLNSMLPPQKSHSWLSPAIYTVLHFWSLLAELAAFFFLYSVYRYHKNLVQLFVYWPTAHLPLLDYELHENLNLEHFAITEYPALSVKPGMVKAFRTYLLKERQDLAICNDIDGN